jgi:23S rRNA maturation mini-RNase III
MQTWLLGLAIVGMSVALAHVGLHLVRRAVPLPVHETQHEVGGFIIGVMGAIYAVLLAFVVVAVWDQFGEAKLAVEKEANQLNDLARMAQGFNAETQRRALEGLQSYSRAVIDEEWETMSRSQPSTKAQAAMDDLWRIYTSVEPQAGREALLYAESLDRLNELSDSRRLRLFISKDDIPLLIRVLLWGGGLIMLAFTYFFGVKSVRAQALMTAALAGEVAFILFLIVALDNPFHGGLRVSPEPLQQVLERIQAIPLKNE